MEFFDKIKKSFELKQNFPNADSLEKTKKQILELTKQFELNPNSSKILLELYSCYVEISNTEKKIECLEKLSDLLPHDFYPLQQLADIYLNEVNNDSKAKFYQNKANKIKNDF